MELLLPLAGVSWIVLLMLIMLVPITIMIWAIVDVLKTHFRNENEKLIWILIVLLAGLIGQLIWLLWGRNQHQRA